MSHDFPSRPNDPAENDPERSDLKGNDPEGNDPERDAPDRPAAAGVGSTDSTVASEGVGRPGDDVIEWPEPAGRDSSTRDLRSDFSFWLRSRGSRRGSTAATPEPEPEPSPLPTLPTKVEEIYEDQGEIGHGGMGTVYRVFDRRLLRESALKIQRTESGLRHSETRRFVEEAQITGQLDHPNIVPIHDLGSDSRGAHYFTMKLVQGDTLEQAIARAGESRLEPDTLADLLGAFIKVCDAIAFSHSRGVIHRDLKPANIMVGEFGQVYVMDWGVARLMKPLRHGGAENRLDEREDEEESPRKVRVHRGGAELDAPGTIIGTPRYMAPEQVQGDHEGTDHRADIFALGGTLYHILTGHAPYTEENYFSLLVQVQNCEYRPIKELEGCEGVPHELERIAHKAMAAEPEDRYPTVQALKHDLERFLRGVWHLPTETFEPGSAIVTEGEEGDSAYIIQSGYCRVIKGFGDERKEVRRMGPGEVFGETAIFAASKRSASVEAIDRVRVTVVTSDVLTRGLGLHSWMGEFVRALANRFRELDARLHSGKSPSGGPSSGGHHE